MLSHKQIFVVGDVHGCPHELEALLKAAKVDPTETRIFFIGDLINKGPDSVEVMKLFHDWKAEAIWGNHEYALVKQAQDFWKKSPIYHRMKNEFSDSFEALIAELESWTPFINHPHYCLVHAGLVPGRPLSKGDADLLVTIRTWDGVGVNIKNPANPSWFDLYEDDKLVVFGHWAALGGVWRRNVVGLDTGCVYGGRLTGLLLPERRLVSVPARRPYCAIV